MPGTVARVGHRSSMPVSEQVESAQYEETGDAQYQDSDHDERDDSRCARRDRLRVRKAGGLPGVGWNVPRLHGTTWFEAWDVFGFGAGCGHVSSLRQWPRSGGPAPRLFDRS